MWPAIEGGSEPAEPNGFEVHLVPFADATRELTWPAGTWFLPEPGRYQWWMEGPWAISRASIVNVGSEPGTAGHGAVIPVGPASRVRLGAGAAQAERGSLRLIDLATGFTRRVAGLAAARRGVLMPTGETVAAWFDEDRAIYTALARPLRVGQGMTHDVMPRPPRAPAADLIVRLERAMASPDPSAPAPAITLRRGEASPVAPMFVSHSGARAFGFFYALDAGDVEVVVESAIEWAPAISLRLHPGCLEHVQLPLSPLPSLAVRLVLPEELSRETVHLSVRESGRNAPVLRNVEVEPDTGVVLIENLPRHRLKVVLQAGTWAFTEEVDLGDGKDEEVTFQPRPFTIRGIVRQGGREIVARVGLGASPGRWAETVSSDDGSYSLACFKPVMTAMVAPASSGSPTYLLLPRPIDRDAEYDFDLPGNAVRVLITSRGDGAPIPGAEVGFDLATPLGSGLSLRVATDDEGVARLPPLEPGLLSVRAEASGFRPTDTTLEIPSDLAERDIEIGLEPVGDCSEVALVGSDGRPLADAQAVVVADADGFPIWNARSDSSGILAIPSTLTGLLAVRHTRAAPWLGLLPPEGSGRPATLTLPSPAPPLTIRVVGAGGEPVPRAMLRVFLDGARLGRFLARWLFPDAGAQGDDTGSWRTSRPPAASLAVLAWVSSPGLDEAVQAGTLDHRAVAIPFPWPPEITVEALR
jgi:hypothetical protein